MNWMLIAYLLVLIYLALHQEKLGKPAALRLAWIWFATIPISYFAFSLIKATNLRSPGDMALIALWGEGISWLLLGISFLYLAGAIVPNRPVIVEPVGRPVSVPPDRAI